MCMLCVHLSSLPCWGPKTTLVVLVLSLQLSVGSEDQAQALRLSYFTCWATLPVLACFPEGLVQLNLSNLSVAMCSQLGGIYSTTLGSSESESLVQRTDLPGLFKDKGRLGTKANSPS